MCVCWGVSSCIHVVCVSRSISQILKVMREKDVCVRCFVCLYDV